MIKLKINNQIFENFTDFEVNLMRNTVASTFRFTGFTKYFEIVKYQDCEVYFDNDKMITGTILNPAFTYNKKPTLTTISGYSKTGVLEDSNMPVSLYPLQFDGLNLKQIAEKICREFGLKVKILNSESQVNLPFEKVSASPTESIKSFISKLANQRGVILSHDNESRVLLFKVLGKVAPRENLTFDDAMNVTFTPNAQGFHSSITGLRQAKTFDNNTQQITVNSPFIKNVLRPKVITIEDGDELQETVNKAVCAEAKSFSLKLQFEGLYNIRSGFYITLDGPILKQRTKFLIESVKFSGNKSGSTTTLDLVLPCVYTGVLPGSSPFI